MKLYQPLVGHMLFPLHEALKGHRTGALYRSLEKSQWLPAEQVARIQRDNLRGFLRRIGRTVPYYREQFRTLGFDPDAVTGPADLACLPLLDKAVIREQTPSLVADDARRMQRFNTGGSTGEPLIFYLGRERISHDVAAKRRATRWWGVDIGDPEIVLWGSPIELGSQDRLRRLRDRLFRTELLSAFEMSRRNIDQFIRRIRQRRPRMLFGYPSSLALLADRARERGLALDDLGIRVAFVTSERLYDHQRESIERTFGCPVANGYGGRDAGFIAHECPRGKLHISAEHMVVEIVDNEGRPLPAGSAGEIVVTHLCSGEFPFLRYRTGDIGALDTDPCACGRGLPALASVAGRATDFVTATDGTVLHGLALIYVLRDIPAIQAFRIVQESLHHIRVEVVAPGAGRIGLKQAIQGPFRRRLGEGVEVTVDYVDTIPPERSGKYRYVVSKVPTGTGGLQHA